MKERNSVSQVREENSSSQNVKLFITAITGRGSSGTGFTVGLSDGSSFFVSASFFDDYNLHLNLDVDADFYEKMEKESDSVKALLKAADLIGRAEQSSGGLFLKLKKKGFSDSISTSAVEKVKNAGLLDDKRFAELWLSSRLRKHPEGRSMLLAGLIARGVPADDARFSLDHCISEEDLLEAVLIAGNKIFPKFKNSTLKLQNALYRRGFTIREIKYFLENTNV